MRPLIVKDIEKYNGEINWTYIKLKKNKSKL